MPEYRDGPASPLFNPLIMKGNTLISQLHSVGISSEMHNVDGTTVRQMRELGLDVQHVICAIDRQQGGNENLAAIGCSLNPVFTMEELKSLAGERAPGLERAGRKI